MLRQRLPLMFIAVSALSALAAHAEDRLLLKSVNVDLPVGDRMFEGPGSDVANNNCLACHSAGMVLFQPALSQAQWHAEVEKMRTAYKAPIDPKDVDTIVAYLVSIRGAKYSGGLEPPTKRLCASGLQLPGCSGIILESQ